MKRIVAVLVMAWGTFFLLPSFAQVSSLRVLAATGTAQEIRAALQYGGEVSKRDANGITALMLAAANNRDPAVIPILISAGADINGHSVSGETPLIFAAEQNPNPEMIEALLKAGARIEDQDGLGRTALMAAAWGNSNPEVISALLKAGANRKIKANDGSFAVDYARNNPKLAGTDVCQLLEGEAK